MDLMLETIRELYEYDWTEGINPLLMKNKAKKEKELEKMPVSIDDFTNQTTQDVVLTIRQGIIND